MIKLILFSILLPFCQSWTPLSHQENKERLEKCGFQIFPTPSPPRFQARDAPWLVNIGVSSSGTDKLISSGVSISSRHVLTSVMSFLDIQNNTSAFKEYCKSSNKTFENPKKLGTFITTSVCRSGENSNCTEMVDKRTDWTELRLLGDCDHPEDLLAVFELEETLENVPICLPNHRTPRSKDEVMLHGMSRFATENPIDLYKKTTIELREMSRQVILVVPDLRNNTLTIDRSAPLVRSIAENRFEVIAIPWESDPSKNIYIPTFRFEQEICDFLSICLHFVPTSPEQIADFKNAERLRTCGIEDKNSVHAHPWLAGITLKVPNSKRTSPKYTGVFITRKHVITDFQVFEDFDFGSKVEGFAGNDTMALDQSALTALGLKITVQLVECVPGYSCQSISLPPVRIYIETVSKSVVILELNREISVTPVCLPGMEHVYEGYQVQVLNYEKWKNSKEQLAFPALPTFLPDDPIRIEVNDDQIEPSDHSFLIMKGILNPADNFETDSRSMLVGFMKSPHQNGSRVEFQRVAHYQSIICKMSEICMEDSEIRKKKREMADEMVKKLIEESELKEKSLVASYEEEDPFEDPESEDEEF